MDEPLDPRERPVRVPGRVPSVRHDRWRGEQCTGVAPRALRGQGVRHVPVDRRRRRTGRPPVVSRRPGGDIDDGPAVGRRRRRVGRPRRRTDAGAERPRRHRPGDAVSVDERPVRPGPGRRPRDRPRGRRHERRPASSRRVGSPRGRTSMVGSSSRASPGRRRAVSERPRPRCDAAGA